MHHIISEQVGLELSHESIVLYEDNSACMNQLNAGFIKMDQIKHVDPQIFSYTQDLIENDQFTMRKIELAHNIADMLTKTLPAYKHKRLVYAAGMRSH